MLAKQVLTAAITVFTKTLLNTNVSPTISSTK